MKRSAGVAGVVAGLLGVGVTPASADPTVVVVACPTPSVCQGRAVVVQCAPPARADGLKADCQGRIASPRLLTDPFDQGSGTSMPGPLREGVADLVEAFGQDLAPLPGLPLRVELHVGRRGVSFSIDSDKKPPEPRPR